MPQILDNVIVEAVPDPKNYTVALGWANGAKTVSSFRHLAGKGVFAAFTDPAFFAQVRVAERGRSLEWPGELDFCADALWFEAHPEDNPYQDERRPAAEPVPQPSASPSAFQAR